DHAIAHHVDAERPAGIQSYDAYQLAHFRFESSARMVGAAQAGQREALVIVDERRAEWDAAHKRVAVLERLETRRRDEFLDALRRDEDRLVEDLVTTRHARGGRR